MQSARSKMSKDASSTTGYLELFVGPMFSGKTSKLLEIYKQYKFCNVPVAVINHSADTRYHESMLSTHDKVMIPCIQTSQLSPLWNYSTLDGTFDDECEMHLVLRQAEVILINEGQFFDDLHPCVLQMLSEKKKVYIAGLDGDFERKKFGSLLDLIPLCDKVTKLTSLCSICKNGTPGIFSLRLTQEKQQMLIGSDNYIPVCRHCYENH
jgi:thymidine kinase